MYFGKFSGLSVVFVIKRLSYVEFRVLWKGKEKEKKRGTESEKGRNGLLPVLSPLS